MMLIFFLRPVSIDLQCLNEIHLLSIVNFCFREVDILSTVIYEEISDTKTSKELPSIWVDIYKIIIGDQITCR